jgi:predicted phage terminase large subunit-like protein
MGAAIQTFGPRDVEREAAISLSMRDLARSSPAGLAQVHQGLDRWRPHAVHLALNTVYMNMIASVLNSEVESIWKRVLVLISPRIGKSDIFSVYGPAWAMASWPHLNLQFGVVGYEEGFASEFGRKARSVLEMPMAQAAFGVMPNPRQGAADNWGLVSAIDPKREFSTAMRTHGAGGNLMGRGYDVASVDDPVKAWSEAKSRYQRDELYKWFTSSLMSRLNAGAAVAVVMQSWHSDDIAHRLMAEQGTVFNGGAWLPLVFPLRAETITSDHISDLGDRKLSDFFGREDRQELWPFKWSAKELAEVERDPYFFGAQRQQRPGNASAIADFKREDFHYAEDLGDVYRLKSNDGTPDEMVRKSACTRMFSIDLATSKTGDHTVILIADVLRAKKIVIIRDIVRKRLEGPEVEGLIDSTFRREGNVRRIIIEAVGAAQSTSQYLKRRGLPIVPYNPGKNDKASRALFASARLAGGGIYWRQNAPWTRDFENELLNFSGAAGGVDDQVDALSQLVDHLVGGGAPGLSGDSIKLVR